MPKNLDDPMRPLAADVYKALQTAEGPLSYWELHRQTRLEYGEIIRAIPWLRRKGIEIDATVGSGGEAVFWMAKAPWIDKRKAYLDKKDAEDKVIRDAEAKKTKIKVGTARRTPKKTAAVREAVIDSIARGLFRGLTTLQIIAEDVGLTDEQVSDAVYGASADEWRTGEGKREVEKRREEVSASDHAE